MSALPTILADWLREHGLMLLIGTSIILLVFAVMVRASRSLSKKNALASTAMLAVAGYLAVALVPLPRLRLAGVAQPTEATPSIARTAANDLRGTAPVVTTMPTESANHASAELPPAASDAASALPFDEAATTAPTIAAANAPATDLADALAWLTLGGIALFALHLLVGWLRLRRILAASDPAPEHLRQLVDLPRGTRLRIARHPVQPFCCGLLRATIVLPRRLATTSAETRFVLLHERAHLTSGDTRARLLAALLRPLLFWHPLYWWLQRQLRFTSELLADDAAAQGSVAEYVRCMMTLSTHPDPAAGGALVATIFRRKSELFRRLEMMLQRDEAIPRSQSRMNRWTRATAALTLVALCAGTFGVERAVAQSPSSERVRRQVRELKAELDRLRAEIAQLHASERAAPRPAGLPGQNPRSSNSSAAAPTAGLGGGSGSGSTYVVKAGDNLDRIARRHYGTDKYVDVIRRSNPKLDPRRLRVGQRIHLPRMARAPRRLPGVASGGGQNPFGQSAPAPSGLPALPGAAAAAGQQPAPPRAPGFPGPTGPSRRAPGAGGASGTGPSAGGPGAGGPGAGGAGTTAPGAGPTRTTRAGAFGGRRAAPSTSRRAPGARDPGTSSLGELADLVTRCIELRGDVEIQEVHVQHASSDRDHRIAQIKLRTKQQQYDAIRTMLKQELQRAEAELAHSKALHEKGFITAQEMRGAESRIVLLTRALK